MIVVSGIVDSPIVKRGCEPCSSRSTRAPLRASAAPMRVPPIPVPRMATSYFLLESCCSGCMGWFFRKEVAEGAGLQGLTQLVLERVGQRGDDRGGEGGLEIPHLLHPGG